MSRLTNQLLWAGFSLTLILGILFDMCALPDQGSRIHLIPMKGLGFSGYDIPLTRSELSLYNHAEVIKRCYQLGKETFVLITIDGARNRHAIHDPMYCYQGAGWEIVSRKEIPIEGGNALVLNLKRNDENREVLYWFTNLRTRHTSVVRYWLQATIRRITLGRSGQEPILVMMQSLDNDSIEWREILDQFGLLFEL